MGTTHVDVTIAGDEMLPNVTNWRYLVLPSLSDHYLIYFELQFGNLKNSLRNRSSRLPTRNQIYSIKMTSLLKLSLPPNFSSNPRNLLTVEDIDCAVTALTSSIGTCMIKSRTYPPFQRNLPWWSKQLYIIRSKLGKARRVFRYCPTAQT